MKKKRVFSGIQPTGDLHIGNYLGAIQNWVKSQDEFDNIFCVVDLHAITVAQDPQKLKASIRKTVALLLAAGIDPEKSTLFIQSHIREHTELTWLLNTITPIGWLNRMTQFKEKTGKNKERSSVGLYDYPVLMAADILLYNTEVVPVGEDQKQHVELARDIAKKFNSTFGDTFKIPEAVIPEIGARIMGLDKPEKKMSKSATSSGNAILLLDKQEDIEKKIMSAQTDSEKDIVFDEKRAGIYNLLTIYQSFAGEDRKEIEARFKDKGYGDFKKELARVITTKLEPLQKRYEEITKDEKSIDSILSAGVAKIEPIAQATIAKVKEKMGLK